MASLSVVGSVFHVLFGCCLVVITSVINCVERLVSEMTCYVLSMMLNSNHLLFKSHLLTHFFWLFCTPYTIISMNNVNV